MAMVMACGVLSFNACDDTGGEDKMKQLLPLSLLCSSGGYAPLATQAHVVLVLYSM
jgi:hypothetical protein